MATNLMKFPTDLGENPENHHFMVFRIYSNSSAGLLGGIKNVDGSASSQPAEDSLLAKLDKRRGADPQYTGTAQRTDAFVELDTDVAVLTNNAYMGNEAPTTTTIGLGTSHDTNASSEKYVCYAFAEVQGYSKFGSYTGNSNANGPFQFLG